MFIPRPPTFLSPTAAERFFPAAFSNGVLGGVSSRAGASHRVRKRGSRRHFEQATVLITAIALLCHVQRIYPIGAGGDAWLDYYQPNFTSVCFVVGVSLLLSSKELWPSALRRPSQPILFCYLALVSAFTVSVTLRTVWLPLTLSLAKSNFWLARKIKTTKSLKKLWLLKMAKILESPSLQNLEVTLVAIVFLHYSLKVSGIYKELLQTAYSAKSPGPCVKKPKSTAGDFSPKISDSFIPFAVRKKH